MYTIMRGYRKFCQSGSNSDNFFRRDDRFIIDLSVCRWRVDGGPTLKAGLVALRTFRILGDPDQLRSPIFL